MLTQLNEVVMKLEEIIEKMQHRNISAIQRYTGISMHTLHLIKTGVTKNPHIKTVEKIVDYLEKH